MLLRMYTRWAERRGFKVEWLEESPGEEAGLKSATLKIAGHNAYGWLKTESGVHRLVRISPYDSQARRHTSFEIGRAHVWTPVTNAHLVCRLMLEIKNIDCAVMNTPHDRTTV